MLHASSSLISLQDVLATQKLDGRNVEAIAFSVNSGVRRINGVPSGEAISGPAQSSRAVFTRVSGLAKAVGNAIATTPSQLLWRFKRQGLPVLIALRTKGKEWGLPTSQEHIERCLLTLARSCDDITAEGSIVVVLFGTGSGQLQREWVLQRMEQLLDNRFILLTYTPPTFSGDITF